LVPLAITQGKPARMTQKGSTMKRIILTGAALAAITTGGVAAAAPAMASNGPAQFVTHSNQHTDTTTLPGGPGATLSSDGGPVWAFDNITVKLTPVPEQPTADNGYANYKVYVQTVGSFHGFADPTNGAPLISDGSVKGSISFDVKATQAPDGAGLLPQQAAPVVDPNGSPYQVRGGAHLSGMISQLFDGNEQIVGGGNDWVFNYQNGNYVQDYRTAPSTWGDVQGH